MDHINSLKKRNFQVRLDNQTEGIQSYTHNSIPCLQRRVGCSWPNNTPRWPKPSHGGAPVADQRKKCSTDLSWSARRLGGSNKELGFSPKWSSQTLGWCRLFEWVNPKLDIPQEGNVFLEMMGKWWKQMGFWRALFENKPMLAVLPLPSLATIYSNLIPGMTSTKSLHG